ncbi:MAG: CpaF family protein [Lachnospiraceae bacterium]|nr:CpaF family protein [Lachnospiraceae bacterium]
MSKSREEYGYEQLFSELREQLLRILADRPEAADPEIRELIDALVLSRTRKSAVSIADRIQISRKLFASVRRLDILQELIDDKTVTEIMVNGPDCIYIEKDGKITRWDRRFESAEKLDDVIQRIVGKCNRVVNEQNPIVDARLEDGSRVNAVIAPVALDGSILTIRQFPEHAITMEQLIARGSITEEAAGFLQRLVRAGYSMLIGGGTSAGKTTFLNALSAYIPGEERIITIEDNAELQIRGIENLVRLEAKNANMDGNREISIRDLIKSALRMRPDRVVVGEVRAGEAVDMLQAMNTGHDGSMSTLHANSAEDMIARLETMVLMAFPLPLPAIRRQIASGVDLMIHLGRLKNGKRRVLEICEVDGMQDGEVVLRDLFKWNDAEGVLQQVGELKHVQKLERSGG